ncbi:divergent polysaccharide deacetylase family protein [Pacificimonas sp. WHA3]|uniref:Divergent polysaccharide deacetylase family protein n=1 Tax=Pacificimonas pallii TaxID=2827236 RepID=A0ABS6SGB0_9SPHN|nr:divergent polysaccharide deacetylase family protein [Pacificimonas pallii]MBV7257425.1 divergent polysaccharide deacetylase family protein [Pacificimonas pallii]
MTVLVGAVIFVGLATLFAQLLSPLAPAQAARGENDQGRNSPPLQAEVRPPIAELTDEDIAELEANRGRGRDETAGEEEAGSDARADGGREVADAPLPDGPRIAVVMTELGPDANLSRSAIEQLPRGVTLTFSPYARASMELAREAHADGHEVFASIPMEPQRYPAISPGRNTLLRAATADDNLERLNWALSRFSELDGVTGMMGSAFTQDANALQPVMKELHLRGLTYIDARASTRSVAERTARENGVSSRSNDRFLDEPATVANIESNLSALISTAKRRGWAIGYARPTAETIKALSGLDALAAESGVVLVGAGRLARGLPDDD